MRRSTQTPPRLPDLAPASWMARTWPWALLALLGALSGCGAALAERPGQDQVFRGRAAFYSDRLAGRPTASGEPYRPELLTAAHRSLPFGTRVRVTNLTNHRSVVVRINDRGPFGRQERILDVSRRAAERIGMVEAGIVPVEVVVLSGPERDP